MPPRGKNSPKANPRKGNGVPRLARQATELDDEYKQRRRERVSELIIEIQGGLEKLLEETAKNEELAEILNLEVLEMETSNLRPSIQGDGSIVMQPLLRTGTENYHLDEGVRWSPSSQYGRRMLDVKTQDLPSLPLESYTSPYGIKARQGSGGLLVPSRYCFNAGAIAFESSKRATPLIHNARPTTRARRRLSDPDADRLRSKVDAFKPRVTASGQAWYDSPAQVHARRFNSFGEWKQLEWPIEKRRKGGSVH
ncbi:MAG: hypothetical protein M1828_002176 [Chrysothrix sp. TS-e1954]|nr:MAG: hypothetical protein M1828_002176 [Chrysothrix sp. TS-e1954]